MVVLDLDGTIYRKPRMACYMLARQWLHLPSLIAERRWRNAQRQALREGKTMPAMPVSETWYTQSYLPSMVDIIREHYTPQEWVKPMLEECRQRKIQVIILSDYEAATDKLLALGLQPSDFDYIFSTGEMGTIKPDPRLAEMLSAAMNNAAIDWRHVLIIGDRTDTDGLLAKALGAHFLLV